MALSEVSLRVIREKVETLPALFARLYSNYTLVSSGRPGMVGWNSDEASQREADAFQLASLGFSLIHEGDNALGAAALRRAAEILEWLQTDVEDEDLATLCVLLYQ